MRFQCFQAFNLSLRVASVHYVESRRESLVTTKISFNRKTKTIEHFHAFQNGELFLSNTAILLSWSFDTVCGRGYLWPGDGER